VRCPRIALNPESGRHIPEKPNPQQYFHAVTYPTLVFGVCLLLTHLPPSFHSYSFYTLICQQTRWAAAAAAGGGAVLVWLRTVTSGRVCYTRQSTVGVHKVLDTLGPAENLSAFQERLCSMELVSSFSHSSPGTEGSFIVKSYKEPK